MFPFLLLKYYIRLSTDHIDISKVICFIDTKIFFLLKTSASLKHFYMTKPGYYATRWHVWKYAMSKLHSMLKLTHIWPYVSCALGIQISFIPFFTEIFTFYIYFFNVKCVEPRAVNNTYNVLKSKWWVSLWRRKCWTLHFGWQWKFTFKYVVFGSCVCSVKWTCNIRLKRRKKLLIIE